MIDTFMKKISSANSMYRKDTPLKISCTFSLTLKSPFDNKQSVKIGQNTIQILLFENYHGFTWCRRKAFTVQYNDCVCECVSYKYSMLLFCFILILALSHERFNVNRTHNTRCQSTSSTVTFKRSTHTRST